MNVKHRGIEIRVVRANGGPLTQNHPTIFDHSTRSTTWSCCADKICWTSLWMPWSCPVCWDRWLVLELAFSQLAIPIWFSSRWILPSLHQMSYHHLPSSRSHTFSTSIDSDEECCTVWKHYWHLHHFGSESTNTYALDSLLLLITSVFAVGSTYFVLGRVRRALFISWDPASVLVEEFEGSVVWGLAFFVLPE